ncbi:uncharacterized protein LOC130736483 [Lotus japonicus]|uniref:uncharacterized protein LOC130736483 n=1 Tax=Lotus japonicus TaxID=34305 RepID=UPI002587790A|nr:uncharacterized protein LOC130736483 [Lotus japonicus]
MRLQNSPPFASIEEIREFSYWILQVGDGTTKTIDDEESIIEIPTYLLIGLCYNPLLELVNFAYPNFVSNMKNYSFFEERAILASALESVEHVNNFMLSMIPGDETEYLSYDTVCRSDEDLKIDSSWFTSEFLNDVKCYGISNRRLILKVGVLIMLFRNIDQTAGLCN